MPHRKYMSIIFAPGGGKRSFAIRLKKWQLVILITMIILGWLLLFAGVAAGIFFVKQIDKHRVLIAENQRLRKALANADTLRRELDELHAMRSLMEHALLVADKKINSSSESVEYIPSSMAKSSVFRSNRGIPELSEYLENQARIQAFMPSGLPVEGVISAGFGQVGGVFRKPHTGVDIIVPERTIACATADGIVAKIAEDESYGIFIEIDHINGYRTLYAHLSEATITKGMPIKRGDAIGYTGQTGKAYRPHIHYEVRYDGKAIDPLAELSGNDLVHSK